MKHGQLDTIKQICKKSAETFLQVAKQEENLKFIEWNFMARETLWEQGRLKHDIRKQHANNPFYDKLFKKINEMNLKRQPVLYYFTLESTFNYNELIAHYREIQSALLQLPKGEGKRNLSALKVQNGCGKYLYCGKVIKDFDLRMVVHMGYAKNGLTWGLQLCRWLPQKYPDLKLKLTAFGLPKEMAPLMGALEYQLAKEYKPILGKHT